MQEHVIEYRHYSSPELKSEGYWALMHPSGCSLASCLVNKALDEPPYVPGRYRVLVATLRFEKI